MTAAQYGSYAYTGARAGARIDYTRELRDLRHFAHLLDEAIRLPVINYRIGLEPLLGLVPIIGDVSGFALSCYIIFKAARLGLPRRLVARMVFNAFLNSFVGSIPLIGDLFDFFWKVNKRNMRLVERYLAAHA
ncbi:DUF4112 domain-containing protein [Truepera radiovictrix]|uniref:DUF4112 domain-containing protein n=1 Tax=Truepera radiovictrix (strain DSM 17093 / CIP 108686 / LMG 22925 / RQ-24) TaxID=649638 RepID=D7CTC2_TRURR|nr:DUF4112 domain-containing protein [Truepera radiovictrix]ADI13779.1 conserved hypothetical protein [Truepera radiovictrix DSM 17093]WMT57655.1 DUF4112 domain-containing protein [Truepera radiovictrix]